MNRIHQLALAMVTVSMLAACGGATAGNPSTDPSTADVTVTTADMAFDSSTITAPADEAFTLALVNNDSMPHNVAIYTDSSKTEKLFEGDLVTDGSIVYDIPALVAGDYFFECALHPEMNGTLVVGG